MPTVKHKDPGQHDSSTVGTYTVIVKSSVSNEPVEGFLKVFPAELRINFLIRVLL